MSNAKFINDIQKYISKSNKALDLYVQKVVLEIDSRLVMKSPVLTGRFKNNWNISNAVPDFSTTLATAPNLSQSKSAASIFSIKANGQTVFVTNALSYSFKLEYEGWSKQSPNGMVRVTLAEMATILNDAAFETKFNV